MTGFPPIVSASETDPGGRVSWAGSLSIAGLADPSVKSVKSLRDLRAYTETQPLSSRLPFSYQWIPPSVRQKIARGIGKSKVKQQDKWARFPLWPLDLSVDFWSDFLNIPTIQLRPTPVVLSHDLDSLEGLKNFWRLFAPLENRYKATSVNFIVPCGWDIDHDVLGQVAAAGHEVGVHGYDHRNKTPFLDRTEQVRRLQAAKSLIDKYKIQGYRAPSLLRTEGLVDRLEPLYSYDSSFPTSGGLFPVPNNGIATARPYKIRDRLWEFPLSMPRDGSLLFLGKSPREILKLWIDCAELISSSGGVVGLLTHCESGFSGQPAMLEVYEEFLSYISGKDNFRFQNYRDLLKELPAAKEA